MKVARPEILGRGEIEQSPPGSGTSWFKSGDDWGVFIVKQSGLDPHTHHRDLKRPRTTVKVFVYEKENFLGITKRWLRGLFHKL
jgi:hypothetical protein